jgi:thiol-disulfide isomerase/thioredoxin
MVLTRVDGSTMKLSESGAKVALINFWATWCEACMDELPSLIKLHEAYKPQGLEILGINLDEKPAKAIASISGEFSLKFPNFMDHDGRLGDAFDVHAIPFTLVIDSSRKILETAAGDRNWMDPAFTTRLKGWLGQADQPKR